MKIPLATIKVMVPEEAVSSITTLVTMLGGEFEELGRTQVMEQSVPVPPLEKTVRPGRLLRAARIRSQKTQKELAEVISVPQAHISQYETCKRKIPFEKAKLLAQYLDIPLDYLSPEGAI